MIDRKNFLDWPLKSNIRTYEQIQKIATGQWDDFTTGCLLDYDYVKSYLKRRAIDLSKQQALDADLKATQQNNFTGNLENNLSIFILSKMPKEAALNFSQGTVKEMVILFCFNIKWLNITLWT